MCCVFHIEYGLSCTVTVLLELLETLNSTKSTISDGQLGDSQGFFFTVPRDWTPLRHSGGNVWDGGLLSP